MDWIWELVQIFMLSSGSTGIKFAASSWLDADFKSVWMRTEQSCNLSWCSADHSWTVLEKLLWAPVWILGRTIRNVNLWRSKVGLKEALQTSCMKALIYPSVFPCLLGRRLAESLQCVQSELQLLKSPVIMNAAWWSVVSWMLMVSWSRVRAESELGTILSSLIKLPMNDHQLTMQVRSARCGI